MYHPGGDCYSGGGVYPVYPNDLFWSLGLFEISTVLHLHWNHHGIFTPGDSYQGILQFGKISQFTGNHLFRSNFIPYLNLDLHWNGQVWYSWFTKLLGNTSLALSGYLCTGDLLVFWYLKTYAIEKAFFLVIKARRIEHFSILNGYCTILARVASVWYPNVGGWKSLTFKKNMHLHSCCPFLASYICSLENTLYSTYL